MVMCVIAECTTGGPRGTPVCARLAPRPLLLWPLSGVRDPGVAAEAGGHRHDPLHPAGPERRHCHHQHQHPRPRGLLHTSAQVGFSDCVVVIVFGIVVVCLFVYC